MLEELAALLSVIPAEADTQAYRQAVLEDNQLHKKTASNREKTFNTCGGCTHSIRKSACFGNCVACIYLPPMTRNC